MGQALYRKYRSKSLNEVVGQSQVTDILARSLKQGKIAHAYLLTGPRGVGKTSIARILAHEINQLPYNDESTHLDIIEIDAASNNGVEDVRDLREKVQIAPVSAHKKVYIIDEVHMLSKAAFNALLKTLEEPPEHIVFILATTDADKLPATIISRTQRFGFRAIGKDDVVEHLKMIADKEKIKIDDASLEIIAERGEGSFRDSISLLDQLSSLADEKAGITPDLVETTLGLAPRDAVDTLLTAVKTHDTETIIKQLDEFERSGVQATVLTTQLISAIRSNIAEHPQLISLLDSLLEVSKSSHPTIKLLTALVTFATPKSKTAALVAPAPSISKPVAELKKVSHDQRRVARPTSIQGTKSEEQPETVLTKSVTVPERNGAEEGSRREGEQESGAPVDKAQSEINSIPAAPVDWAKLIDYVRANHVAIYSVLSKCSYEQSGDTLKLYTGTPFYKKKLDDAKYRPLISKSLIQTGAGDLIIETIPTPPPPKDQKAAAVAALMGGGEEVSVS